MLTLQVSWWATRRVSVMWGCSREDQGSLGCILAHTQNEETDSVCQWVVSCLQCALSWGRGLALGIRWSGEEGGGTSYKIHAWLPPFCTSAFCHSIQWRFGNREGIRTGVGVRSSRNGNTFPSEVQPLSWLVSKSHWLAIHSLTLLPPLQLL